MKGKDISDHKNQAESTKRNLTLKPRNSQY